MKVPFLFIYNNWISTLSNSNDQLQSHSEGGLQKISIIVFKIGIQAIVHLTLVSFEAAKFLGKNCNNNNNNNNKQMGPEW